MALSAYSDLHPDRRRTRAVMKCDACGAPGELALDGFPTYPAMRKAFAAAGWDRTEQRGPGGKPAHQDRCPACARGGGGLRRPRPGP